MSKFFLPVLILFVLSNVAAAEAVSIRSLDPQTNPIVVTHEMMNDIDTAVSLERLFDVFQYNDLSAQDIPVDRHYCFDGDIGRVCSLLAKMSRLSLNEYRDGLHQLAKLEKCWIQGAAEQVVARVSMRSDFLERVDLKTEATIGRCSKNQ